jgi:hypothetical protein
VGMAVEPKEATLAPALPQSQDPMVDASARLGGTGNTWDGLSFCEP